MKPAKTFIICTLFLFFALQVPAQKSKTVKSLKLSVNDKTEIVKQVFDDGFEKLMENPENDAFQTCLTPLVRNEKVIFIATEIEKKLVKPKISGYRFMVISDAQMSIQVQKEKGECYFRLTQSIVSDSEVKIILARYINKPPYIYGTGFRYAFEKVNGKWRKRLLENYKYNIVS
jgi:hypothetical protein